MNQQPSKGTVVFAYLLIMGALYQSAVLLFSGYEQYAYLHQELSEGMVKVRYGVSWLIKIAGFVIGIGLLRLKEWARLGALVNSVFIIATVHLKHSYKAYSLHTAQLDRAFEAIGGLPEDITFKSLTEPALFCQRALDIVFCLVLAYFLTRPTVKSQFKPH